MNLLHRIALPTALALFLHPSAASLAASAPPARPAAKAAARAFPYDVVREVLPNGLKVLMVPMPSDGLVSYWTVVRTGSRDEVEAGVTGFAHFFEHMMFRGTDKYPGPVYDRIVSSMGADANAFTSDDITAYHMSVTRADLPTVIEIESDRFQNLKYPEDGFKTEAGAVFGEYRKGRTSPWEVLDEAIRNAAFDRHTYKHTTIGFVADVEAMPKHFDYSKGFFKRFYRPENCVVLVVGDFDPKGTMELIRKSYSGWKKGYEAPKIPVEPEQKGPRRIDVPFDGETLPILTLAFKGERYLPKDPLYVAAQLIPELAFGETSDLYRKLVLDEQRLQMLGTSFDPNRDPGLWWIFGMVKDPADLPAVEGEIWGAVDRLRRELPDRARLDAARSRLKYEFLSRLNTPGRVAGSAARIVALTGDLTAIDDYFAALDRVTPEEVRQAADKWLRREHSTVAILRNRAEPPVAASKLPKPVLMPVAQDPLVSFEVQVKAGSQDDPPGKEGLAYLTAEMVADGGTARRPYDELLRSLFPMAAGWSVSVDRENTVVSGEVHRDLAAAYYDLFAEALLTPGFRAEDFERIRSRTRSEIEKELRFSSDEELGKAALAGKVYAGTRYAHIEKGTLAGLDAISLDDVKQFWKSRWTRTSVVPAIGGSYQPSLADRFVADLGRLPEGTPATTPAPAPQRPKGRQVLLVEKPGDSTAISFGYPIDVVRGSREFYALWIANSWLGEHRNSVSHLYQVIREARGMNYGDYSYIEPFPLGGYRDMPPTGVGRRSRMFEVWVRPVPHDRALFALRAALREVDNLAKNGLTKEQFEAHRAFLAKYGLQFAKTTGERLGYALDDRWFGLEGEGHLARFRRMMSEITLDEVNAAIRKYLRSDDLVIALVTADAAKMKAALVSGAPSPIDYGVEKSKQILDEDREIEKFPLGIDAANVEVVPVARMFEK